VAQESLSALRTVQAFNAVPQETQKFHERVQTVLTLARKEAVASGIFFGSTGWSGNVTLLALLGYGWSWSVGFWSLMLNYRTRWYSCDARRNIRWRLDFASAVHCLRWERFTDANVCVLYWPRSGGSTEDDEFVTDLSLYVLDCFVGHRMA
jgi:ABC-type multidrug transport system fused ATPase/permease subunit